jgi:hypothetical protein
MITTISASSPNGEMNGLTYQPNSGIPTAFQGRRPDFSTFARATAPITNVSDPGPMLNNRPGNESNATIQYARVVPLINDFDRAVVRNLNRGVLCFVVSLNPRDDPLVISELTVADTLNGKTSVSGSLGNRTRGKAQGQEVSEIVGWPFLSETTMDDRDTMRINGTTYQNPTYGMMTQNATIAFANRSILKLTGNPSGPDIDLSKFYSFIDLNSFNNSAFLAPKTSIANPPLWTNVLRDPTRAAMKDVPYEQLPMVMEYNKLTQRLLDANDSIGALVPDGMIINKYETEDDAMKEAVLDASQHGLFNVAVAGHSLCTSWASFEGKRKRDGLTFPRHELYILIVATPAKLDTTIVSSKPTNPKTPIGAIDPGSDAFVNIRFQRANTNQMYNLSKMRKESDEESLVKPHEIVIGAWRIASVIDTAASKLDVDGVPLQAKSSYALTTSVRIRWVTALELFEKYDFTPKFY